MSFFFPSPGVPCWPPCPELTADGGPQVAWAALVSPARRCFTAEETSVLCGNHISDLRGQHVFSEQQPDENELKTNCMLFEESDPKIGVDISIFSSPVRHLVVVRGHLCPFSTVSGRRWQTWCPLSCDRLTSIRSTCRCVLGL